MPPHRGLVTPHGAGVQGAAAARMRWGSHPSRGAYTRDAQRRSRVAEPTSDWRAQPVPPHTYHPYRHTEQLSWAESGRKRG
jgi:hypothetical protein